MSEWIRADKMLPEIGESVLIDSYEIAEREQAIGKPWGTSGWRWVMHLCGETAYYRSRDITHWFPLPPPPSKE